MTASRSIGALTWALAGLVVMACGGGQAPPPPDAPTPERPPRGDQEAMEDWLARAHYLGWRCEDQVFPPRLVGGHGRQKICSNAILVASTSGPYPVDAASVKLLYGAADQPNGFAVGVKIAEGEGAHTWYWYERRGPSRGARPVAEGIGVPDCAVCHQMAARDYVFFRAP